MAPTFLQQLDFSIEDFCEFQNSSRKLENSLTKQLEKYEDKINDLITSKSQLVDDNDKLVGKIEGTIKKSFTYMRELQDENTQLKNIVEEMTKYVKELLDSNEELNNKRKSTKTLIEKMEKDFQLTKLHNKILQEELCEKEKDIAKLQILQDECRDLKGALAIRAREKDNCKKVEEAHSTCVVHGMNNEKNFNDEYERPKGLINTLKSRVSRRNFSDDKSTIFDTQNIKTKLYHYKDCIQNHTNKETSKSMLGLIRTKLMPSTMNNEYVSLLNTLSTCEKTSYIVNQPATGQNWYTP